MSKLNDLHTLVRLLKEFELPLSPILEYAIQERLELCTTTENEITVVRESEPLLDVYKDLEDYAKEFANLSVGIVKGKKLPHKAILLLAIMHLIEECVISENRIELDKTVANAFATSWKKYLGDTKLPSVWIPFWYLKSDSFWHFKPNENSEVIMDGLIKFAGHPSIGQMRHVIKYAYLDDALFGYFRNDESRNSLKRILEIFYIEDSEISTETITSRLHRYPACESGQGHWRSISTLRIWINDHEYIQEKNAVQSMIKAVNLAGPARVAALRIPTLGEYLVQKNWNKVGRYAISQKELNDGWLIQTCCNSARKKKQLERISDALGLGWRVELVEKH